MTSLRQASRVRDREQAGFKVLGYGEAGGFFQLSNGKHPIKTVADMKGLKMRTMTLPSHQNLMKAYGAAATPVAWAEVYTALQTAWWTASIPHSILLTGSFSRCRNISPSQTTSTAPTAGS